MTTVVITHEGGFITGFTATGHTGYAEEGEDIVCAAVSAITQTAMMGLQHYEPTTQAQWEAGDDPILSVKVPRPGRETEVILRTMVIGLEDILSGVPQYVRVIHKGTEVETT